MIKKFSGVCVLLVMIYLLTLTPAFAQIDDQKPFSKAELTKFMADWPQFASWAEKKGEHYSDVKDPDAWIGMKYSAEMQSYLKKNGWKAERFFYILHHVVIGLMKLQMEELSPQMNQQLEAQIDMIKKDPNIPEAQKQQMIASMEASLAQTKQVNENFKEEIPAQEMALIKADKDKLMKVFEMAQDS